MLQSEIQVIKSKRELLGRARKITTDKIRVAAYCRVSTDREEQLNSYNSQVTYYKNLIAQKEEWEYVDVYADQAITGTKIEKRENFQRLINDCSNGQIDMIITKSISRFARNTLDTLKYVRLLKEKNVAVLFEEEKINTMTMDGELLLVVLSSVAQQEVENISANVKKGIKMKMQRGEIVGYNGCLGYDYNPKDKSFTINEEEAEVVRYIFNRYVEGAGGSVIARELRENNIPNKRGNLFWHDSTVRGIIKNEKYIGDVLMGKTFTVDPISKRRLKNMGEEDKVYIRNHHEPIISKAVFYKAQEIMKERSGSRILGEAFNRKKYSRQYAFSCMLKCGFCGNSLTRRSPNYEMKDGGMVWHCVLHTNKGKKYCPNSKSIKEKVIEESFVKAYNIISKDNTGILEEFISRITEVLGKNRKKTDLIDKLKKEQFELTQKKSKLVDSLLGGIIDKEVFDLKSEEIEDSLKELTYQINTYSQEIEESNSYQNRLEEFRRLLSENEALESFDRAIFESVINYVLIGGCDEEGNADPTIITLVFKSGVCSKDNEVAGVKSKLMVKEDEEKDSLLEKQNNDKREQLGQFVEIFRFEQHYPHFQFNENDKGEIIKKIKNSCEVRVAIALK